MPCERVNHPAGGYCCRSLLWLNHQTLHRLSCCAFVRLLLLEVWDCAFGCDWMEAPSADKWHGDGSVRLFVSRNVAQAVMGFGKVGTLYLQSVLIQIWSNPVFLNIWVGGQRSSDNRKKWTWSPNLKINHLQGAFRNDVLFDLCAPENAFNYSSHKNENPVRISGGSGGDLASNYVKLGDFIYLVLCQTPLMDQRPFIWYPCVKTKAACVQTRTTGFLKGVEEEKCFQKRNHLAKEKKIILLCWCWSVWEIILHEAL